jgi:5-methylcytosine-specific restriction endonuclease McrA
MKSKIKFALDRLQYSPHETINPTHDADVQYRSNIARKTYLQTKYKNEKLIPIYFRCDNPVCKNKLKWEQMQIHHVFPIRLAPQLRYDVNNMLLLCPTCHHAIHALQKEEIE